jgi:hypothetical protein
MVATALKTIRRVLGIIVAAAVLTAALPAGSRAQQNIEAGLARLINEMQTGHVNLRFFAPRMRQLILVQTNRTLVYPQLARLGPPVAIHLLAERQLPRGVVYGLRSDFAQASVNWVLAFDRANIIEAFSFQFTAPGMAPGVPQQQYPQQQTPPQQQYPPQQPQQQQTTTPLFSAPFPVPQQQVASQPPPAQPPPPSGGSATVGATDDACKLYPNLC